MAQRLHKKCIESVCAVIYDTRVEVNDVVITFLSHTHVQ